MKKIIMFLFLCTVGLLSCSSCKTTDVQVNSSYDSGMPDVIDAAETSDQLNIMQIKTDEFQFALSDEKNWKITDLVDIPAKLSLINESQKTAITFTIDKFTGSDKEYALFVLRGFKESGHLFSSLENVKVNNKDFSLLSTYKDDLFVFTWIFSSKKEVYVLSCAGKQPKSLQKDFCDNIAKTLVITI